MYRNAKKILVVDDEEKIVEVVKTYLEKDGHKVFPAYTGQEALELFDKLSPALVVLDLMLPDISGEEICIALRKKSRVPIIMLTAKTKEEDVVSGLDIGAVDYVTKPFSPKLLAARVMAQLRRAIEDPVPLPTIMVYNQGDLVINDLSYEVRKQREIVNLTPIEYKVLVTLSKFPSKVFTREELIFIALGGDFYGYDRTIDSHIKNLRQKLEDDPKNPVYILTIHGVGYKFGGI